MLQHTKSACFKSKKKRSKEYSSWRVQRNNFSLFQILVLMAKVLLSLLFIMFWKDREEKTGKPEKSISVESVPKLILIATIDRELITDTRGI